MLQNLSVKDAILDIIFITDIDSIVIIYSLTIYWIEIYRGLCNTRLGCKPDKKIQSPIYCKVKSVEMSIGIGLVTQV